MAGLYVDTSALGRVLLAEHDAPAIRAELADYTEQWSSELVTVELARLGRLHQLGAHARQLLAHLNLLPITTARLQAAAELDPARLRTLDAIHLATALELRETGHIDALLTYDHQLRDACAHHQMTVRAPA